jgi:hypothetical protein
MDPLTAPIDGAEVQEIAGVRIDVAPAGNGRVKRAVYPAGFRWSTDMKPHVDSDLCLHAHIGFLARGAIAGTYPDGGEFAYEAPAFVVIEPGHDAWVVGDEDAVLIQFDAAGNTAERFGLHEHAA